MKRTGLAERAAKRASQRSAKNFRSDKGKKRRPYKKRVKLPPPPPEPISKAEAEAEALRLLHLIILGPDELLDASIECARELLKRPIAK